MRSALPLPCWGGGNRVGLCGAKGVFRFPGFLKKARPCSMELPAQERHRMGLTFLGPLPKALPGFLSEEHMHRELFIEFGPS